MTNSDDHKFDDFQNPDEELDISMFFEDDEKVDDVVENDSIDSDFPEESLHGENTQPYADELDMFADLDVATADAVELPMDAEESGLLTETDDVFSALESIAEPVEQMEMIDPILAAIEDVPVVENKKEKKTREKAEKAQAIAQAKAAKAQAKADKAAGTAQAKAAGEDVPVVEDKKAKKAREKAEKAQALAQAKATKAQAKADKAAGKASKEKPEKVKAEKPPKTEKPLKAKKEKKPKVPGDKQPQNVGALTFMAGLVLMLLVFGGVNAYAVMKHGIGGAMVFLAIFDLLAAGALVIPIMLRRSKETVTASDVGMGIAAISLIVGCMFVLANLAYNLN